MTIVEMRVHMDCDGCQKNIRKALQKLKGVDDIDIDMTMQKVTVMGWAAQKKILKTVRKTGRRAEFWPYPYNPEYHAFTTQLYYKQQYNQTQLPAESIITYNAPPAPSSYNYYKHGYDGHDHGYYQQSPYSTIIDDRASAMFSDENPHACSIM